MDDLISRKDAINAVDTIGHIATMPDGDKCIRSSAVKYVLSMLPSAQPEILACGQGELISRQVAIDVLDKRFDDVPMELTTEILQLRRDLRERIPSAQPATSCSEIPNGSDDTISRQVAIDALEKFVPYAICDESTESYANGLTDAYNLILQLPSAQPEIIRCRDCKYWRDDHTCHEHSLVSPMCANEYCSRAERRTDETD